MPNQVPTPAPWEYRQQPGMTLMRLSLRRGKGEALAVDLGALAPDEEQAPRGLLRTRSLRLGHVQAFGQLCAVADSADLSP
jgi:hypothetical protein